MINHQNQLGEKQKTILSSALALMAAAAATTVQAADDVKLQLNGDAGPICGYYVALDKGYAAEDHKCHNFARWARYRPPQVLVNGGTLMRCCWMPSALVAREVYRGEYCPAL